MGYTGTYIHNIYIYIYPPHTPHAHTQNGEGLDNEDIMIYIMSLNAERDQTGKKKCMGIS